METKSSTANLIIAHLLSMLAGAAVMILSLIAYMSISGKLIGGCGVAYIDYAFLFQYICVIAGSMTSGCLLALLIKKTYFYLASPIFILMVLIGLKGAYELIFQLGLVLIGSIVLTGASCYTAKKMGADEIKPKNDQKLITPEKTTLFRLITKTTNAITAGFIFTILVTVICSAILYSKREEIVSLRWEVIVSILIALPMYLFFSLHKYMVNFIRN